MLIILLPTKYRLGLNSLYKLTSLIYLFLLSVWANATKIRGRIIDAQSGQPIRYAKVFVSPVDMEIQSNKDGKFILSGMPKSDVYIIISAVGFPELNFKKRLDKEVSNLG